MQQRDECMINSELYWIRQNHWMQQGLLYSLWFWDLINLHHIAYGIDVHGLQCLLESTAQTVFASIGNPMQCLKFLTKTFWNENSYSRIHCTNMLLVGFGIKLFILRITRYSMECCGSAVVRKLIGNMLTFFMYKRNKGFLVSLQNTDIH